MRRFDLRLFLAAELVLVTIGIAALFTAVPESARAQYPEQGTWLPASAVGGTGNVITLTVPNVRSLNDLLGVPLRFYPKFNNTTNAGTTVQVNTYSTENILRSVNGLLSNISIGDLAITQFAQITWDGTEFVLANPATATVPVTGQVYLRFNDSGTLYLCQQGGASLTLDKMIIQVPGNCIISSNLGVFVNGVGGQTLSAGTDYDVFIFLHGGNLTFDFWNANSGPQHMTDTTPGNIGVEVRSNSGTPDSTRSYVGKIETGASGQFQSQGIGVISWFNRRWLSLVGANVVGPTTAGATLIELNSAAEQEFLSFGVDSAHFEAYANTMLPQTAGTQALIEFCIDGTNVPSGSSPARTLGANAASGAGFWNGVPSEGAHVATVCGQGDIGTNASFQNYRVTINVWG